MVSSELIVRIDRNDTNNLYRIEDRITGTLVTTQMDARRATIVVECVGTDWFRRVPSETTAE